MRAPALCTGRVWTLAERLARCSQEELLQHWLPLPLWMGMVLDALLSSEPGGLAKDMYWGKLFPATVRAALESIVQQVQECRATKSMHMADEDLPRNVSYRPELHPSPHPRKTCNERSE
jgi:hypothetical protein